MPDFVTGEDSRAKLYWLYCELWMTKPMAEDGVASGEKHDGFQKYTLRPLQKVQFGSRSRRASFLTAGIPGIFRGF